MKEFYKNGEYRIILEPDTDYDVTELKGDMFRPELHSEVPIHQLKQQEVVYIQELNNEGVQVATLQRWNPDVGEGWFMVDCIGGFIGDSFKGSGYDTEWIELIDNEF